ncbi:MAG: pilus assembly protein [Reyranella sp.]|nr:pilus assembly protein [Reyranella sp.]
MLRRVLRALRDTRGVSALEFAIISPVLLTVTFGVFQFGITMNDYLILTNAAAKGAMTLALSRGTSTPYASTTAAINAAASTLVTANITVVAKVNGVACTTDSTCSAILVVGQPALVKTTYPCNLTVMGINYAPGGCTLSAETAQMVQ